ncbi:MAG: hypothetical protein EA358_07335 [Flavobacteriales bacterium]|nr:MAG: hypothetical protein EA358_07335 [Flavobacteriales bacterium]
MFERLFYLFSINLMLATFSVIGQHGLYDLEDRQRQNQLLQNLLESSSARSLRVENWLQTHQKNRYFRDSLGTYYTVFDVISNQYPLYQISANSTIASILQTSTLFPSNSFNLSGNGIEIGLWEAGNQAPLASHEQLTSRISNPDNIAIGSHATWIAGTLIASGNGNPNAKGMAPEASIVVRRDDNTPELLQFGMNEGLISDHSYQVPVGWFFDGTEWTWWADTSITQTSAHRFGQYSDIDQELDKIARVTQYHLIVRATGNLRGIEPPSNTNYWTWDGNGWITLNTNSFPREKNGGADGYDCIPMGAVAKNILTVGGVTKNQINGFYENMSVSGWGPADDGRIKPDLVAPGSDVTSTSNSADNAYGGGTGTSFSTAAVSGSLVLVQEMMMRKSNRPLLASTLKGLAIHTANSNDSIAGPNYRTGWGLLNTEAAVELIENLENGIIIERDLEQGEEFVLRFLNEGNKKVKATICWIDPESPLIDDLLNDRSPRLVNDLDIRLTHDPDNTSAAQVFFPWKLDPNTPSAAATRADNSVDNVEVIEPETTPNGLWELRVTYKNSLSDGSQRFSLILEGVPFEWNASSANDTLWSTPSNWKGNAVPPENAWVYVGPGKSQLTLDLTSNIGALTVNENANVVIYGELEVNGDIHNRGNVFIKDGQLKWNGSYWGEIDYLRSGKNNWVSIGAPTSNTIANQLGNVSPAQGNGFSWNANDAEWESINPNDTLKPGAGHLVFYGNFGVDTSFASIHFNGKPNQKSFFELGYNDGTSSSATFTNGNGEAGWNLLSNPFTSALDFSTWFSMDFDLENAFYIWNSVDEEYQAYSPAVNGILTPHIAPLQGFWVQKKSHAPPTVLPNTSIRKHAVLSTAANFLRDEPFNTLILVLENNLRKDSTFLVFIDGTSNQYDSGWDAWKLPSQKLDLATRETDDYLSINAVDVPNSKGSIELHVYSEVANSTHEFRLNTRFLSDDLSVWLEDKQLERFANLRENPYIFTIDTNQITGRFILHYGMLNLDREDFIFNDKNKDLFLYHFGNELHLHAVNQDFKDLQIDVFHSGGQKVFTSNIQELPVGSQEAITLPKLPSGLYVAVVNNGRQHIKFIIP